MHKNDFLFSLSMQVRDYECDLQGVVNNANYLHYLEHTRHRYLLSLGESFARLHDEGIDLFVSCVNICYRQPLRSGDRFVSGLTPRREGPKLIFEQTIYRLRGDEHEYEPELRDKSVYATVECVAVVNGRLSRGDYFDRLVN
ncbi:MAG: acyl-CoA thioesterase [Tannerellaceae bacterium]|nr:acyl-CoA thioesterase [Tannerellaceae bacterium]